MKLVKLALTPPLVAISVALCAALLSFSSFGDWYVAPNGTGDGSEASPFGSVAEAVTAAIAAGGGTVNVADGDYYETEEVILQTKAVKLIGTGYKTCKIIQTTDGKRVLSMNQNNSVVQGFTLTGGRLGGTAWTVPGAGAYITSGTIRDCRVTGNSNSTTDGLAQNILGLGLYLQGSKVTAERCIIDNNSGTKGMNGGGVWIGSSAVLRDSLICGNVAQTGGGIYLNDKGRIVNCTVVDNTATTKGGGLFMYDKQTTFTDVVNCIFKRNKAPADGSKYAPDFDIGNAVFVYPKFSNCIFDRADFSGCSTADPVFTDPVNGDYTLAPPSSAIDSGVEDYYTETELDVTGAVRKQGAGVDLGCYELNPAEFAFGFYSERLSGGSDDAYRFHSGVQGASGPVSYEWTFYNEDTSATTTSTEATPEFVPGARGTYTVTLTVSDGVHAPLTRTFENYLTVKTSVCYVDPASKNPVFPYSTPATAATTFEDAYGACGDGCEIVLLPELLEIASPLVIERPVIVRGTGAREDTVIRITTAKLRVVEMNNRDAVLKNVTLTGATQLGGSSGAVLIGTLGGTVTNCVIRDNASSGTYGGPAGVRVLGGRLTGCLVTENSIGHAGYGAVNISGTAAVVDHCQIVGNYYPGTNKGWGSVYIGNGTLENCLIANNTCPNGQTPGVYVAGSAIVRNCTIANNDGGSADAGGLYWAMQGGARIINCIIAGNTTTTGNKDWNKSGATKDSDLKNVFFNCFFDGNTNLLNATNILADDPGFKDAANNDYALTFASPCKDSGTSETTFASTLVPELPDTDLAGNDRVMGDEVDRGAYEYNPNQLSCEIVASQTEGFLGQTFALTSNVPGASGEISYFWRVACGDAVITSDEANPFVTPPAYGRYDVSLTVTTESGSISDSKPNLLYVAPRDIYVRKDAADPKFPFATDDAATDDAVEALNAAIDGARVHVSGMCSISSALNIDMQVVIEGTSGRETDGIKQTTSNARVVSMNNAGAVIRGLTLTGGRFTDQYCSGAGVYVGAGGGLLEDCEIKGNELGHYGSGTGLYVVKDARNFIARRCVIRGQKASTGTYGSIYLGGGVLENCLFDGNAIADGWGSAVYVTSADVTLRNCTFVGNHGANSGKAADNGYNGAIFFSKASLETPGLEIVNCLFDGNYLKTTDEVANWNVAPGYDADNLAAAFTTCAFTAGELPVADDETKAMLVADSGFTDDGTYRLTKKTALRGKGTWQAWMDGATDLYGHFRANALKEVAVGCCEPDPILGLRIIVR